MKHQFMFLSTANSSFSQLFLKHKVLILQFNSYINWPSLYQKQSGNWRIVSSKPLCLSSNFVYFKHPKRPDNKPRLFTLDYSFWGSNSFWKEMIFSSDTEGCFQSEFSTCSKYFTWYVALVCHCIIVCGWKHTSKLDQSN